MRLLLIIVLVLISAVCFAQGEKKAKQGWKIHSLNQVGIVTGELGSAYSVQSILAFKHCSWIAGVGAGIDDYKFRGIPVFFDLRKEWGNAHNAFFLYADAGIHVPWLTNKQENEQFHGQVQSKSNGLYTDVGLGYRLKLNHKNSVLVSGGYTYKHMDALVETPPNSQEGPNSTYSYRLNRLTIKIGWLF